MFLSSFDIIYFHLQINSIVINFTNLLTDRHINTKMEERKYILMFVEDLFFLVRCMYYSTSNYNDKNYVLLQNTRFTV